MTLQQKWIEYIETHRTNNIMERKIRREAFMAGADAILEISAEAAGVVIVVDPKLTIVGGKDYE